MSDATLVPLSRVLHLLPPSAGALLQEVVGRGLTVECHSETRLDGAQHQLVVRLGERALCTGTYPRIAPAMVHELVGLAHKLRPSLPDA